MVTLKKKINDNNLSFKRTEQRKKVKIENLRKLRYWECFKEGKTGRSRNAQIQGRNRGKAENGSCRKKRQEEWEDFSHCMMLKR